MGALPVSLAPEGAGKISRTLRRARQHTKLVSKLGLAFPRGKPINYIYDDFDATPIIPDGTPLSVMWYKRPGPPSCLQAGPQPSKKTQPRVQQRRRYPLPVPTTTVSLHESPVVGQSRCSTIPLLTVLLCVGKGDTGYRAL